MWPWNLTDDLENNRAPLLCCVQACESFRSHQRIKTRVTVRKGPIWVKMSDFLCYLTLKFDRWPWKTSYSKLCASFHSNRWIQTRVTVQKRSIRVKIGIFFTCGLDIWRMALENNRSPLLCYLKLCASFHSYRRPPNSGQIGDFFLPCLKIWLIILKNNRAPRQVFVDHFEAINEFKLELQSGNGRIAFWPLWPWPLTLTLCMDITFVNGNGLWKFHDDTMTGTLSKRCDRRTDRQTDGPMDWLNHS